MGTQKHLKLTGISNISWKDAITSAISEASKTLEHLSNVTILDQTARIDGNKIVEYYATIDLTFFIDKDR